MISRRQRAEMAHGAHRLYQQGQLNEWEVDRIVAAIIREVPEMTLLEARRFAHGWSRPEVIDRIATLYVTDGLAVPPLNSSMLCRWEHGDRLPSAEYRDSLCRLYRVGLGQLGLTTDAANATPVADRYCDVLNTRMTPVMLDDPQQWWNRDQSKLNRAILGARAIDPSNPQCALGGSAGECKAEAIIRVNFDKDKITLNVELRAPVISCMDYSPTLNF